MSKSPIIVDLNKLSDDLCYRIAASVAANKEKAEREGKSRPA